MRKPVLGYDVDSAQPRSAFIREFVAEHKLGASGERGPGSRVRYSRIAEACVSAGYEAPSRQAVYAALNIAKRRKKKG